MHSSNMTRGERPDAGSGYASCSCQGTGGGSSSSSAARAARMAARSSSLGSGEICKSIGRDTKVFAERGRLG